MEKKDKFIIAVFIQVALLVFLVFYALYYLANGQIIYLRVTPANSDNKVVTGGNSIALDYDIDTIVLDSLYTDFDYEKEEFKFKDKFYLSLEQEEDGMLWTPTALTISEPEYSKGKVYLVATFLLAKENSEGKMTYRFKYDFDDYFVVANSDVKLNTIELKDEEMAVKILAKNHGVAKLLKLVINGEEVV